MVRATYILVFLLYLQTGCFGNPVTEPEVAILRVYNYHGEINATNSADNETISRWTVSGKLSVYNQIRRVVVQLEDVKTSVYNGLQSEVNNTQEKEIPEEAKVLLQPFTVVRHDVENISIYFLPNEPLWSQNFKRGLASNLDLEVDMTQLREAEKNPGASIQETTLYGRCDVHYKASFDTAIVYERSFRHSSCVKSPRKHQVYAFTAGNLEDYASKTVKTTTLLEKDDTYIQHHMVSVSHIQAQILPATPYLQYIDQITKLDLLDYKELETPIPIDILKMTDKRELIYEVGEEPTSGRHTYDTSTTGLTKQFLDNYDIFNKYFQHSPLQQANMNNHDSVENMFLALKKLDIDGLKHLEKAITDKNDQDLLNMYFSLLPYIGTQASVKYLIPYLVQDKYRTNEMLLQKIMSVFPIFIDNYTDELLDELEALMNTKHFHQQSTRNAGVLSFAAAVAHAGKNGALTKTKNIKYTKLFIQKFMGGETYEERMVYLMALINMDDTFDLHLMNHIITNTTESKHIRTLALAGFKHLLVQYSDVTELYEMYWPIVQNKKEPFDLRVRVLDLLLSVNLSQEQFDTIIKKYNSDFNDPQDKQLANYVLTSLHSLQNITYFQDYLGAKASEALTKIKIRPMETFSTGNYRLAHSDKEIGAYLQTRIISNPFTNLVNSMQVTYKSYGFSYNLNGYSVYLNIDGLFDSLYTNKLFTLLTEKNLKLMSFLEKKDCHVDIVVFKDTTVVYAVHFNTFERVQIEQIATDLIELAQITVSVQFPLVNYIQMPSDLGTPLQFSNVVEDISFLHITPHKRVNYRTTWNCQSWIEAYNPLVDTNIATYKYTGIDKAIDLKFKINTKEGSLSWLNRNDSIVIITDNIMGTSVEDEDILKQYCEKCEAYIEIDTPCLVENLTLKYEKLGFKFNVTKDGNSVDSCMGSLGDTAIQYYRDEDYKSNIDAFSNVGPIVYLTHIFHRKMLFVDDFSRASYRSLPFFDEDTITTVYMAKDINYNDSNLDPFGKKVFNFTVKAENKIANQTEVSSYWQVNFKLASDPEHVDDTGKKHFASFITFNIKNGAAAENEQYKVCTKREIFLPSIRSDKYSLEPVEPTNGTFVWSICKEMTGDDDSCTTIHKTFTFVDTFSTSDKAKKLKIEENKEDYDECIKNSKDLNFIAPTSACQRASARLADYDNYESRITIKEYPKEKGGEIETKENKIPVITYSRKGNDYMELMLTKDIDKAENEDVLNVKIYQPRTANPIATTYLDSNNAVPFVATSTCTITPKTIEQFSGKYTPNPNKEWFAFSECYNETRRDLTGHTIGKHNVGFTYRTFDNVFTATVKNGKAHVEIDGKELPHKTFAPDDSEYKVYFLAHNVIMIVDNSVNIYYNTEYVQVTVNALYSTLLCGACTQKV